MGENIAVYIKTALELYGSEAFDADYSNENAKKNVRKVMKRIINDEKLLR